MHHAGDCGRAAGGLARLALAAIDGEGLLKIAKFAIGAAIVFQAGAARLDRLGINVSDKYQEPADHLAIELDLMGNLIIHAAEATTAAQRESWLGEQEALLHEHLLAWFPRFEAACRAVDQFGFYGASARLLGVFLTMDANYLSLVKPAQSAD